MNDWKDIHPDFAEKPFWSDKTYQKYWEQQNFTYQEAKDLLMNKEY